MLQVLILLRFLWKLLCSPNGFNFVCIIVFDVWFQQISNRITSFFQKTADFGPQESEQAGSFSNLKNEKEWFFNRFLQRIIEATKFQATCFFFLQMQILT